MPDEAIMQALRDVVVLDSEDDDAADEFFRRTVPPSLNQHEHS